MKNSNEITLLQQSRLAEALKERGMMQKELASLIGYTPAGLNRIFKGKVSLERKTAQLIGRVLCVRPEWLLGEDSIKTPVNSKWLLNRFEGLFSSFRAAGYELEQIEGGVLDPFAGLVPDNGVFIIRSTNDGQLYKCTYAEITRLLNSIEATERALVQSFARTSCPVEAAEYARIQEERRAQDLAAYNDGYQDPEEN